MPLVGRPSYRLPKPAVATFLLWIITVQGARAAETTQVSPPASPLPSSLAPSPASPADGDSGQLIINEELLASIADLDPEAVAASGATAADIRWMLVTHSRQKRNVVQLGEMIRCATGCNPVAYKGYGCYCGFLGSGEVVDGIDKCCFMHDKCYGRAKCSKWWHYVVTYDYSCRWGYPHCKDFGAGSACARQLCECDRQFAKCLRRYPCPSSRPVCSSSPLRHWQNLFLGMRSARSYRNRLDDSSEAYGDSGSF